ncbi:hypothetical protein N7456_010828 [Penicillium angulare]|uniref:Uncharacterized protein n=1 Tax=Penicillium angulare TaxID=116970 RepID=A0A9W9K046_9EURO|nr:hypothetical protein N7456_010828 [Penicillium angulare]
MYGALSYQMQSLNILSPKPATPFKTLTYGALAFDVSSLTPPKWIYDQPDDSFGSTPKSSHICPHSKFDNVILRPAASIKGFSLKAIRQSKMASFYDPVAPPASLPA